MTVISQTEAIMDGSPGSTGLGGFFGAPPAGPWGGWGGPLGPPAITADHDVGDIKMAARTDDHVDGSMTWMLCDGRAVNRVTYASLFAILNVAFGPGDGATTFNLPTFAADGIPGNPLGRFPMGVGGGGYALGAMGGTLRHVHGTAGLAALAHVWNPSGQTSFDAGSVTVNGGAAAAAPFPHDHVISDPLHDAANMPDTDALGADVLNTYVAVGFFIRVD